MAETLMKLGEFTFSVTSVGYDSLAFKHNYRWQTIERLHRIPTQQFVGDGEKTIDIDGIIYPQSRQDLDILPRIKETASEGSALLLVDGLGFIWGEYVIVDISEGHTFFTTHGIPKKITFQLQLKKYS